ncbi:PleD family two-component system response regulator [Henriciella aquimarina]|uniref:PleD family two-component system response regulator n=1 Tax=Henriciella aquimarina TaxID=545261 RepID=UPI000A02E692|nr:PleD family two-component system response regulator [Henriciella aquimarina]
MSARILVVDDILANRRLMQAKLEAKYYSVLLAENGQQAIELTRTEEPDIILLDIMMPGMDGYEVCRRLKEDAETAHIPIVMLTALSETADRVRGLQAGADDFLTKPVDDFALMARINALNRYNAVAGELRKREASGVRAGALSEEETLSLDRKANVLLVDTNPRGSKAIRQPLEEAGHRVLSLDEAGSPGDRRSSNLDIVLLSLSHQTYDPLRLCAHFRTSEVTRGLSIIVVADPQDQDMAAQALELGANDVILTPIISEELTARVSTQTKRTRYMEILRRRVDRGLELSVVDQLTGLYNRRYMTNQLALWMKRAASGGQSMSVIAADIDHFKQVNDKYGHEAGDRVLQQFAERILTHVRPKDIVCRPGGEEFLIIMPETSGQLACKAAERIRRAIAAGPFELDSEGHQTLSVTVSAGVAAFEGENDTVAAILKRADEALYRAKTAGRNRVSNLAA